MAGIADGHDGGSGVGCLCLELDSLLGPVGPNWHDNGYGSGVCSVRHVVVLMYNIKLIHYSI
jgi:hypothetical protein